MLAANDSLQTRQLSLKLGLYNGLLIGLALTLGTWGPVALTLGRAHVRLLYPNLLLGSLALLALGSLGGWLTAWFGGARAGGLVWIGVASLSVWTIGHLPYEGHSLMVWLVDRRFWGLPVYPFNPSAQAGMLMAGFFIVLLLTALGLIQNYRLEGIRAGLNAEGRLDGHAWFLLTLPLPLVLIVGLFADDLVNRPLRGALQIVHEAIRTGRTYPGDLFELSLERSFNYNAIAGVRDQMSQDYALFIGEAELGPAGMVSVVAHFDNGAWINCRVVADQLSHCYDASPPYRQGFLALITGETLEDCQSCFVKVSDEQRAWLLARSSHFAGPPRVIPLAQWGSHVLMRAGSPGGDYAIECLFHGISPVRLERCRERPSSGRMTDDGRRMTNTGPSSSVLRQMEPPTMPMPDRLAPPAMPANPTQADYGAQVYHMSCMACHGDRGQGLTQEWREAWDPGDRNCWQSKCHAANYPPGGFMLPGYAPAVIGPTALRRFQTALDLYEYIKAGMPWQAPGSLGDEEYWQLTAYLVRANGVDALLSPLDPQRAAALELHQK